VQGVTLNKAEKIEEAASKNQQKLQELKQLKEECDCNREVKDVIQEQIQKIEQEQERLGELAKEEKKARGIFGWLRGLFG